MYNLSLQNFNGPFDLLLKLLDEKKLDIKDVSLVAVTDQFIDFIKARKRIEIWELASFLGVAAHLLFLKSKAALPSLEVDKEEEESAEALKEKLERYREVQELANQLKIISKNCGEMFSRFEQSAKTYCGFYPPENLSAEMLKNIFEEVMAEYKAISEKQILPEESIQEIVSLEEKIMNLRDLVSQKEKGSFNKFTENCSRIEIVVSFLALLELIKQDIIYVFQFEQFNDITIKYKERDKETKR